MKEYTLDELRRKAASYCSIAEHCVSEVEKKLIAWKVDEADRETIIAQLIEDDFINEKRYANAFARDKFNFNKWGKIKISMALVAKGLDKELINDALDQIDEGEYEEMLATILQNKEKTIKYEYEYEKQGKLFRFAQGRGFESDVIDRVMRRL